MIKKLDQKLYPEKKSQDMKKIMRIRTFLPAAATVILLVACSPEPVFRLQHNADEHSEVTAYRGMDYVISDMENSSAILAYYRHIGDRIVLELEVMNFSEETVRFDPADFSYAAYRQILTWEDNPDEGDWEKDVIGRGEAVDPESIMLDLDKEASKAEARERTNRILDGISVGLEVASDISAAGRETADERAAREARRTRDAINRADRRDQFYRQVAGLSDARVYWETQALRRTDLMPGESIAGEISIPAYTAARFIEITVMVGDDEHRFLYRQLKYQP